ncbi:MAG: MBL fold metallo-hydrolase [Halopseudomonas yangmingensis]|uniref:Metallo-beta-lactamase family protein n=1 Tax=Halopseudomonas yangmingensis TaxID=1720063 RepID=A0A1I4U7V1_9GAMM|nr:MBL fold metallo-hydrolase [Halopseudomonas yangmingensis]SFM84911.1 metallo-beta-lactamase family protein [Halopseudomonas yangmingensis]
MALLTFHGATRQVTGSCYLLEANGEKVLLECGMNQGFRDDEESNRKPFPFDPASLNAVVISHAHLDHSGLLPRLVAAGYSGPIYLTPDSADLLGLMLRDAAGLQERDAEWENRWRSRAGKAQVSPLYTMKDTEAALELCQPLDYQQPTMVARGIEVTFHDAGHILGSAIVELVIHEEHNLTRRLVFSGDLGNPCTPLMRNPATLEQADLVLMESTYGDRDHRGLEATIDELREVLQQAFKDGGNVLIPSFAVGRTQELLYFLGKLYQEGSLRQQAVFLDSPMAIAATRIYDRYHHRFDADDRELIESNGKGKLSSWLPILKCTATPDESMAINRIKSGAIIIAGSGMCTGGRIVHHFKHNLWREECHVIFPGFQAKGTLGRRLVDGARNVRVIHQSLVVKAQLHTLGGLSAHAGQGQLIDWLSHFKKCPEIYLVHGELEKSQILAEAIHERLGWPASIPEKGEQIAF